MTTRRPGMSREESREETRRKLLDAGLALLRKEPVGKALSQVKAQEVARRAGVTAGAFYYYWPSQDDYIKELLEDVFSPDRLPHSEAIERAVQKATGSGAGLEETVRAGAVKAFELVKQDAYLPVQMALWGKREAHPGAKEGIRNHYEGLQKKFASLFEDILKANNLKVRSPFTVNTFAATLMALSEGMFIRWSVDPDAIPDRLSPSPAGTSTASSGVREEPWNLFAAVVLALVPIVTAPIGEREDNSGLLNDTDVRLLVGTLYES